MKIRTRLAVLFGAMFIASGVIIGGSSALIARHEGVNQLDSTLSDALSSVENDPNQDVSGILTYAESSRVPISAMLYFDDSESVVLTEGKEGPNDLSFPQLELSEVTRAAEEPFSKSGIVDLRIAAFSSGNGEWVVVGASMTSVNQQFRESLSRSIQLSVAIAALMTLITYLLVRRALIPITRIAADAMSIADGNLEIELQSAKRGNEIGQLTNSLQIMVNSLKQAVLTTANSESKMREFLGDASHELRTPLTVIRGYIDILNSGQELTIEQRERAMNRLSSESLRMSETINDLLLLAEIGEMRIDDESSVDLSSILVNQIQDLSEQQKERVVKSTIASEVHVQGDFEQISRMVANVISNIARHTPKEAQVEVLLSRIDGKAVLVFDDAGPGLSDEMYARSHEGFQRFDRAHSKNGGGFGLGLSILSSIVQRHNGELSLSRSNLGGLRTQITLPLASLKV